jgi:hypothetical protein
MLYYFFILPLFLFLIALGYYLLPFNCSMHMLNYILCTSLLVWSFSHLAFY